ncbi:PadR family transcriptional regulator [Micromonospora sagamiensis]|uniref:Transcriptional regulator, PadR family n=1 Tax=Micromonospora sagamiensis TaxID=47875 RepID=A0A562WBE8_9ACTN|nr:helix-turn-helix transcriptional regulator [Micromonospora sagamiensis]TWJ26954.1 transcriptional regulator, PadR family [Micromonospora sagamiensis]
MRMTLQVQLVLRALLQDPERELYGLEIVDSTGLPPGTIYPILARLEAAGWVESRWEVIDQQAEGRPRRRYYRLPPDGRTQARSALAAADARRRTRTRTVTTPGRQAEAW